MTAFAFPVIGVPSVVRTAISAAPATYPGLPQAMADAMAATLASVPDSLNATATISGDLGWVPGQIAGTLVLSMQIHIA